MNAKAMQKAAAFLPQPLNGSSNFAFMINLPKTGDRVKTHLGN